MIRQLCWSIEPTYLASGLLLVVGLSACSSADPPARTGEGAVESRGLSRMQQPVQPGMA